MAYDRVKKKYLGNRKGRILIVRTEQDGHCFQSVITCPVWKSEVKTWTI